ncbi:caspase family protein [Nocardia stercoris]|uniref:caspase family protein n=1 Tax=Nocardia stercoris TaxID=2483361 RepID=UPI001319CC5F|nr:caspase family protein [Nocardia stercoris]
MELNSPRTRIVLAGTSSYDHLPALDSVAANLTDLEATLKSLHDPNFVAGIETVPNPERPGQLSRLLQAATADELDVLLFYYSGHGLLDEQQQLHLAVTESDPDAVPETALAFSRVRQILSRSRARVKVVVLDCCFSGRAIGHGMADPGALVAGQLEVRGAYTLASSAADLPSLAPPGLRNTAFTDALLRTLRQGVPGGSEPLLLGEVATEVHHQLAASGLPTPRFRADGTAAGLVLAANPGFGTAAPRAPIPAVRPVAKAPNPDAMRWLVEVEHALSAALSGFPRWSVDHSSIDRRFTSRSEPVWEASLCPGGNHSSGVGRCPNGVPVLAVASTDPDKWNSHGDQSTLLAPDEAGLIVSRTDFPLTTLNMFGDRRAVPARRGWQPFMGGMSPARVRGKPGSWVVYWPGEREADEISRDAFDSSVHELVRGAIRARRWWRRLAEEF